MSQSTRLSGTVTVLSEHGLHLSPCARVSQTAQKYSSRIYLKRGPVTADARSILDLMTLAAEPGAQLELIVEGDDSEAAFTEFVQLFSTELLPTA